MSKMNRLSEEKSPYLLQHATNPVDWYPWGSEAFEAAREGNKLIFLSVGYSTCHWCHVMERESFESQEVRFLTIISNSLYDIYLSKRCLIANLICLFFPFFITNFAEFILDH